jgi:hypothetical protein
MSDLSDVELSDDDQIHGRHWSQNAIGFDSTEDANVRGFINGDSIMKITLVVTFVAEFGIIDPKDSQSYLKRMDHSVNDAVLYPSVLRLLSMVTTRFHLHLGETLHRELRFPFHRQHIEIHRSVIRISGGRSRRTLPRGLLDLCGDYIQLLSLPYAFLGTIQLN